MKSNKQKIILPMIITIIILLLTFLGLLIMGILSKQSRQKEYDEKMKLGEKYLKNMEYEDAILAYEDAINIDKKQPDAYISLSQIYVENKDYEAAKEVLSLAPVEEMKEVQKQEIEVQISNVQEEQEKEEESLVLEPTVVQEEEELTAEEAYQKFLKQPENEDCYYKFINLGPDNTQVLLIATTINISWEFQDEQTLAVHDTTVEDKGIVAQTGVEFNQIKTSSGETLIVEEDGCTAESCDIYYFKEGSIMHQEGKSARDIYDVALNEQRLVAPERGVVYIYTLENGELNLEELSTLREAPPTYDSNKNETILFQKNKDTGAIAEEYYAYIKENLIPKYGLANIEPVETILTLSAENFLEPGGIVSASVYDMDRDGEEELIVFYYKEDESPYQNGRYIMYAEIYEKIDGEIQMIDSEIMSYHNRDKSGDLLFQGELDRNTREGKLKNIYISWYEGEDATRLVIENTSMPYVFTEGRNEYYWTMKYKDGILYTDLAYVQTRGYIWGFEYIGYKLDENDTILSAEKTSMEDFFGKNGIQVTSPRENYSIKSGRGYDSLLINQEKAIPIYQSTVEMKDMSVGETKKASAKFTTTDWTNLRENIVQGDTKQEEKIQEIRDVYYGIQNNLDSFTVQDGGGGTTRYIDQEGNIRRITAEKGTYNGQNIENSEKYVVEYYYKVEDGKYRLPFVFIFGGDEEYRIYYDENRNCIRYVEGLDMTIYDNEEAVEMLNSREDLKKLCSMGMREISMAFGG